jgi:hypothetical protein
MEKAHKASNYFRLSNSVIDSYVPKQKKNGQKNLKPTI